MFKRILDKALSIAKDLLNKYDNSAYIVENLPESKAIETLSESVDLVNYFYRADYLEGVNCFGPVIEDPTAALAGAWDIGDGIGSEPSGMALVTVAGAELHLFTREDWENGDTVQMHSFEAWYEEHPDTTFYHSVEWTDVSTPEKEIVTITEVTNQDFYDPDAGVWVDNPTETITFTGVYVCGQDPVFSETVTYS